MRLAGCIAACVFFVIGGALVAPASAAINKRVNFQGKLTNSAGFAVADGSYNVEFKLHNDPALTGGAQGVCSGSCLWMETRTASKVTVTRGLFSVQLGEVAALTGVNFDQDPLYLSVRVGGTGVTPAWDAEMTPRQRLGAAPQAFFADNAGLLGGQLPSYYTNAANLTGTLADARLSTNVALRNVNNNFSASQTITGQLTLPTIGTTGGLILGGDTNLYRLAADNLASDDAIHSRRNAGEQAFLTHINGEAASRWKTLSDGTQRWGDGAGTHDTNLYRSAPNQLKTDDEFVAAGGITTSGAITAPRLVGGVIDTLSNRDIIGSVTGTFSGTWASTGQPNKGSSEIAQINAPNLGILEWSLDGPGQWALNNQAATFVIGGYWRATDMGSGVSANLEYWDSVALTWVVAKTITGAGTYEVANPVGYNNPPKITKVRLNVTANPTNYFRFSQIELWAHSNPYGYLRSSMAAERMQTERLGIGADTNLYRSAANQLKTDDEFVAGGGFTCTACIGSADIATGAVTSTTILDGTITVADLAFDPATQAELDAHKTSTDHDGRYYTEAELNTAGTLNTASNPVDWTKLKGVPAGLADGVDDTGASGAAGGDLSGTYPNPTVVKASGAFTVGGGLFYSGAAEYMLGGALNGDNYGNIRVIRSRSTLNDGMYIGYGGTSGGAGTAPLRFYVDGSTSAAATLTNTGLNLTGNLTCTGCVHTADLADGAVTSAKILDGTIAVADTGVGAAGLAAYSFSAGSNTGEYYAVDTWTKVTLDGEEFDPSGRFDPSTSRYTAAIAGIYRCNGAVSGSANTPTDAFITLGLYKNGGIYKYLSALRGGNGTSPAQVSGSTLVPLLAGEYVELWATQRSSAAYTSYGEPRLTYMQCELVGKT